MRAGRTCPDLDAKLFFDPDEIQAAYLLNKKLAPPALSLNDVLRMIARAGGFLAKKSDGEPGARPFGKDWAMSERRLIHLKHYAK